MYARVGHKVPNGTHVVVGGEQARLRLVPERGGGKRGGGVNGGGGGLHS
jgi:hypothetical protein